MITFFNLIVLGCTAFKNLMFQHFKEIFQIPLLQCLPENIIYDLCAPTSQEVIPIKLKRHIIKA